jgi:hypothetical protein
VAKESQEENNMDITWFSTERMDRERKWSKLKRWMEQAKLGYRKLSMDRKL